MVGSEEAAQELTAAMLCDTYLATGEFHVVPHLEQKNSKAGDGI